MVASDLVEAASAGEVLVSEQIHELLRGAGRFEPVQGAPGSGGWSSSPCSRDPSQAIPLSR